MPINDNDTRRLIKYLRDLDYLYKKEPNAVKSVLTMVNFYFSSIGDKKIRNYQELAEKMLDFSVYKKVVEFANELIQDQSVHETFMKYCREESGEIREALVMDYMQSIPTGSVFYEKSTLTDLINFFRKAPPDIRYFLVVDELENSLKGIVSVNDFTNNIDIIKKTEDKSMLVVDLDFYNANPRVITDSDKMESAANLFTEATKLGKRITKLLVVNLSKKPVGFIGEPDIVRWEAGNL